MTRKLILAIDIGTSSVRAALYDHRGKIVPRTLVKNDRQLTTTADGGSEIDADKAFRQLIVTVDDVLKLFDKASGEISHVAASCFWHSFLGVDAFGKPTTKVLSWADNRSRDQVAVLRRKLDEEQTHNTTGARFHSSFWPAKLLWVKTAQPESFSRTVKWLSLSDYFALRLTGDASTSISMASATGIFDIRGCVWDGPLLKFLKIKEESLPPIAASGQTTRLNKKFARRWPSLANAEWFPAIGDGAANNIGSRCTTRSRAALMVGTSGAMRVAYRGAAPRKIPDGLWCYRIDRDRVVIGGALSDGGGLYNWAQENIRLPSDLENIIAKRSPAGHGLSFLPFLAGERSTGYHEFATGAISGLTSNTSGTDIAQAAIESVAYRFAKIFDQLNRVVKINDVIASGGALRASNVWTQIIADVLGRETRLVDVPEASLTGAVLLAVETIGNIENIEKINGDHGKVFRPDLSRHKIYRESRKRHQKFYKLIISDR